MVDDKEAFALSDLSESKERSSAARGRPSSDGDNNKDYSKRDDGYRDSLDDDPDGEDGALGKLLTRSAQSSPALGGWGGNRGGARGGGATGWISMLGGRWLREGRIRVQHIKMLVTGVLALLLLSVSSLAYNAAIWPDDYVYNADSPTAVYEALQHSCRYNAWRPGLYVNCTLSMGLNNLRSEFSTCLKFAFDAGAGLVMPNVVLRDSKTLSAWALEGEGVQFTRTSHYFDTEGLRRDLSRWCPEMDLRDQFDTTNIAHQVKDKPRTWWEMKFKAGEYRPHFDELLQLGGVSSWSPRKGAIVEETMRPYAIWDYRSQDPAVTHAWFDLIRFAPRLTAVAEQLMASPLLAAVPYVGVHLRLENDTFDYWSNFDAQTNAYAYYIDQRNETTIYLACGDRSWKPKFAARFPNHRVVDKWDLAPEGTDLRDVVTSFSFDEMAVLDYIPMLKSELVMGIGVSSFAYLLGVDRRVNRTGHYADTLHQEIMPPGSPMVGDDKTLLLPFILPEYYNFFP